MMRKARTGNWTGPRSSLLFLGSMGTGMCGLSSQADAHCFDIGKMSLHFSANQYEEDYKPHRLGNWEAQQVLYAAGQPICL